MKIFYNQKVLRSTDGMKGFRGLRLLRCVENREQGISINLWDTKKDLERFVDSSRRKNFGKDAERLYTVEFWVKHFEVRSSTI